MARIELYKVFNKLGEAEWEIGIARSNLAQVPECEVEASNYNSLYVRHAKEDIDRAMAELQKAKQILTKG